MTFCLILFEDQHLVVPYRAYEEETEGLYRFLAGGCGSSKVSGKSVGD